MAIQRDWDMVRGSVESSVRTLIETIFEGEDAEKLAELLTAVGPSMMVAVQRQDKAQVDELNAQLEGLLEIGEIRSKKLTQANAAKWLGVGLDVIFGTAVTALRSMKVV